MPKLLANLELSLNGVTEAPETWPPMDHGDVLEVVQAQMAETAAILFGRATFQHFEAYWPRVREDPSGFAAHLRRTPKFVVSRTLKATEWENTTFLSGDPADEAARLKDTAGGNVVILGSGRLVSTLAAAGVIDEFQFWLHPLALARGAHLFEGGPDLRLRLLASRAFRAGIVQLTYAPG
ncbi:MAG TPA: dihydrofolate reductase family protein [Deinococcales bacterium]|nr:dihydrofolate reductase family protein [Deinococcales bacterium]